MYSRLELQHHLIGLVLDNKLFLAPLKNPKRILDQGTGTGTWSMDFNADNICNVVIGTDLSNIQPTMIPQNCFFEIDDVNLPWIHEADSVDFVFSRFGNGFSKRNWDHYLSESFNCLVPGGWAEIQDMDFAACSDEDSVPQDSAIVDWHRLICEGASDMNINMRMSPVALKAQFENAGFTNVQVVNKKIPIGPWAYDQKLKEIGSVQLMNFLDGLEAFSLAIFCRSLRWSAVEIQVFLAQVRQDAKSHQTFHRYWNFFVVYGQKPVNERV
ncbi:S-adenosyl-L-methionine-dependent methyltransferase [Hyaloscypha variabilis F]|uniref:S-adenosyl-L-methionine-dependent methyltransferase n=1 Tax=Hyaloscypha variabilis (strain UAMH 11265 / GT02V1 / F) TaxID=1149755 RepID=A0A2J6SE77_HYAVF|nr:S-adenosyl-L-methionine-dependent methyltransferase [Hyaloscypha variabilis F]